MDRYELAAILVLSLFLIPIGYLVFIFVILPLRFHLNEKRHPPKNLDDPVFGSIEFRDGLWSSVPTRDLHHMIGIVASETGPTRHQREFYIALRNDLAVREAECKAFIARQTGRPSNLSEMSVYAVEIGTETDLIAGQFVIELSDREANEIHRVEFKHGRPESYGVDD
jgi:hypothetical protein